MNRHVFIIFLNIFTVFDIQASTCYGTQDVIGLYVEFEVKDKAFERAYISEGAPAGVRWSGNNAIFLNKEISWESIKFKSWIENESIRKQVNAELDRLSNRHGELEKEAAIHAKRILLNPDTDPIIVEMAKVSNEISKLMSTPVPFKIVESNYIDLKTPLFDIYYEMIGKYGYGNQKNNPGHVSVVVKKPYENGVKKVVRVLQYDRLNQFLGASVRIGDLNILGYTCELRKLTNPKFRLYPFLKNVEMCLSRINGYGVVLYTRMGDPANEYREKAVRIEKDYHMSHKNLCIPSYVKMN